MRAPLATISAENHEVRRFVAYDLSTEIFGEIKHTRREAYEPPFWITAS